MTKSTSSAARAKPLTTARLKSGKNNAEGEDSPLSSLSSMSSPSASPLKAKKSDKNSKDDEEEEKDQDTAEGVTQNELQEGDSLLDGLLNFGPGETSTEAKNVSEAAKSPFESNQDEQLAQKENLPQVSHSVPLTSIHTEQDSLIAKPIDFETIDVLQNSPIAQQLESTPYEPISVAQPAVFDNTIDPQQFLQSHAIDPVYEGHQEEHVMVDDNAHQEFNPEQIILDIVESQERFTRSRSGRVIKQTNSNMAYNDEDDMDNDFVPSDNDQDDHSAHSGDNKRQRKNEPIQYHPIEGYLNMKPRELGRGVQIGSLVKAITKTEDHFNFENIQTHKSLLPYLAPTINVDHWTPIVIQLLQQDLEGVSEHNSHIKEIYSLMIQILKAGQANEPMPSLEYLSPQASQLFRHFLKTTDENIAHDPYILTHICRKLTISVMFKYNIPIRSFSTQANSLYSMYGDSNNNELNDDNGGKNGNGGDDINAPMSINFMKQYNPFKLPAKILTMLSKK